MHSPNCGSGLPVVLPLHLSRVVSPSASSVNSLFNDEACAKRLKVEEWVIAYEFSEQKNAVLSQLGEGEGRGGHPEDALQPPVVPPVEHAGG